MTPEQLTTLKAAILAETDAGFVEYRTQGATGAMAAFYNEQAAPAFYVWRSSYTPDLIANAIDVGVTQLDGLTASKRDSLLWWANRQHDARLAQTRAAINDLCGSQNTLKNAVLDGAKRPVTRGEKLYCTGAGTLASPAAAGFEGTVSNADIVAALEV
jgi:hypothetical protein